MRQVRGKILVLLNNPLINDGRVIKQIRSMTQRGFEITVLCRSDDKTAAVFEFEGARVIRRSGFISRRPAVTDGSLARPSRKKLAMRMFLNPIKKHAGYLINAMNYYWLVQNTKEVDFSEFDLIHAHDLHTLPTAAHLSKKWELPYLYDAHEYERHNLEVTPLARMGITQLERRGSQKAARVITVCNEIGEALVEQYKINAPLIIPNTPVMNSTQSTHTIRTRLGLPPDTPLIVYTGHFTGPRARDEILAALTLAEGVHLAVVGSHPRHEEALVAQIKACSLDDRVHLIEHQASETLVPFISDADLALLIFHDDILNHVYAMPNKLFESAFAKLPIIYYTKLLSISNFMREFDIGYPIDSYQPEVIAQAIRNVMLNKQAYQISNPVFDKISQRYGWENQMDKLESIYLDTIHSKG